MNARARRSNRNVLDLDDTSSEDSVVGPDPPASANIISLIGSEIEEPPRRPRRLQNRGGLKASVEPLNQPELRKPLKSSKLDLNALLANRELGRSSGLSRKKIQSQIQDSVFGNPLTKIGGWVGASGDVLVAAWTPEGSRYAVGSGAELDQASAQYNRRNNLLFGHLEDATIYELPDHYVDRQATQPLNTVSNTTLDPELYTTITGLAFDTTGNEFYTSSYDKTVKVWDLRSKKPTVLNTLQHDATVTHLVGSSVYGGSFVTGQSTTKSSIRLYTNHALKKPAMYLESDKAQKSKEPICPSALQLGTGYMAQYLLAGFAGNNPDPNVEDKHGDICLWDLITYKPFTIRANSSTVFDLSWHPRSALFTAAMRPANRAALGNRLRTKSLIRIWQPLDLPSFTQEYECPALDVNEVQFHPWDDNLILASCTDGATYVWDYRMGDELLHKFQHDQPIDEMSPGITREEQDTGVRMAVWSKDGKSLFTGASDGKIKAWDVLAAPEDAAKGNVADFNSGVMCGAWDPDHRNLLVGLAQGAVEIWTSDRPYDYDDMTCLPSKSDNADEYELQGENNTSGERDGPGKNEAPDKNDPPSINDLSTNDLYFVPATIPKLLTSYEDDCGVAASKSLLESEQLILHPVYGAGKGPNYRGPYAKYAHGTDARGNSDPNRLLPQIAILQLDDETRKQARRDGGHGLKKAVKRADIKIYREAENLAQARNVELFGKVVEGEAVIASGKKRKRGEDEKEDEGGRKDKKDGEQTGDREKKGKRGKRGRKVKPSLCHAFEDRLEDDHWLP